MSKLKSFLKTYKIELTWAVLTLAIGGLGALLTGSYGVYKTLEKPPFSPPCWLFPIAWTLLYLAMGYAAGLVAASRDLMKGFAIKLYLVQLLINIIWPIIFFRFQAAKLALVWLALLIAAVIFTYLNFKKINRYSGFLFLPYITWCLFAFYLNFGVVALN